VIVPDVNLLVFAYNSDAPHHTKAREWWRQAMDSPEAVGMPWAVALGFLRLMTSPRVLERPFTAGEALESVRSRLARRQVRIVHPGPRHLDILAGFAAQQVLSTAVTTDAHIAAIAIELGAEVRSNDGDFARFPGLRWRNPLL
jgi:toxin-antitoxin system PIN domain toxin